jgi:hypothetical protein
MAPCRGPIPLLLRAALALPLIAGCSSGPPKPDLAAMRANWSDPQTHGLELPTYNSDVEAVVSPPIGWKPKPLEQFSDHTEQTWVSPTGQTAYGVIHFGLPLPVSDSLALSGFLAQMKKQQGEADLLDRRDDPDLPGIRFEAQGGRYHIRANLIVATWEGWAIFAGTLKGKPDLPAELDFAVRAREHTKVGQPKDAK